MLWAISLFLKEMKNPNSEPDEKGEETRDLITTIEHDPADR